MTDYNPHNPARAKSPKPAVHQQGAAHHTPATRTMLTLATGALKALGGGRRTRRPRRTAATAAAPRARKKRSRSSTGSKAHMVKGSAAAKKHMASLRKMRGKAKAA